MIHGRNILIYEGDVVIAAAKSCTINTNAEAVENSSPASGTARSYTVGRTGWEISISTLVLSMKDHLLQTGHSYTLTWKERDSDTDTMTGTAICTAAQVDAAVGNLAQGSFQFLGSDSNGTVVPEPTPTPSDYVTEQDVRNIINQYGFTTEQFVKNYSGIAGGTITIGNASITPVSSIAMSSNAIGLTVSGSPITSAGTFTLAYASGYEGFTTALKNKIEEIYSWFEVDAAGDIKTKDTAGGHVRGLYSESFVSSLGKNSEGGGGGVDLTAVWASLTNTDSPTYSETLKININHIPNIGWSKITNKPTTLAGYGITDAKIASGTITLGSNTITPLTSSSSLAWGKLTGTPTTLAGYGIGDAKIANGVITLGSSTITPVTSVAMTVPTGFSVSGSPISKTGTLAVTYASGYEGFTTTLKNKIEEIYSWFEVDAAGDIKTKDTDGGHVRGLYSESFVSSLGKNSEGGGGGVDLTAVWASLTNTDSPTYSETLKININHIPNLSWSKITTGKPTTISGYGISDAYTKTQVDNALGGYLPLSGGTLTGSLKVATGYGISDATGNGLLVYKPATTWGGISSTQWGVGADVQGVIRSGGRTNLLHYDATEGVSYVILDTNNTNVVNGIGYINGNAITKVSVGERNTYIYNSSGYDGSSTVTVNDLAASSTSAVGMIYSATDNPMGKTGWFHAWSQAWQQGVNTSWVSQIAIGTANKTGMYYRSTNNTETIVGKAWTRVLDSSNYNSYSPSLTGTGASGTWGISISGNAATATKATQDGNGDVISSTYLPLSGGALTGELSISTSSSLPLTLSRTAGAYYCGISFSNSIDGNIGNLGVSGSANAYNDDYPNLGTLRYSPSGASTAYAVMHNGLDKFITATASSRKTEYSNTWINHYLYSNDGFSLAWSVRNSNGDNLGGICGCYGASQAIQHYFIGGTWNNPLVKVLVSNGNVGIGLGSGNPSQKLHVSGNILASGEVTASSDERKKTIISNTKFNVKDIASARSIIYEWNDDRDKDKSKKIHGGSIAQDWLGKADSFLSQDNDGWYSINYGALALCSAITIAREVLKHSDEIDRLKQEVSYLKARVAELQGRRIA